MRNKTETIVNLDHGAIDARSMSHHCVYTSLVRHASIKNLKEFFYEMNNLLSQAQHRVRASGEICILRSDTLCGVVPDGRACKYKIFTAVNPMTSSVSTLCAIESIAGSEILA